MQAPLYIYRIKAVTSVEVETSLDLEKVSDSYWRHAAGLSRTFEDCVGDIALAGGILGRTRGNNLQAYCYLRAMPLRAAQSQRFVL